MTLNDKLATIQTKFKSKKSRFNSFGKYNFRSAEDILEATKPFLLELGVTVTINEEVQVLFDSMPVIESVATISDGKNAIHATAVVGVDMQQKGMQTAQQFGAASTYAKKYALGNLFLIDDTEDADATNTHGKAQQVTQKPKAKITKEQMNKAVKFVKDGGSVDAIKKKYELTSAQIKQLA